MEETPLIKQSKLEDTEELLELYKIGEYELFQVLIYNILALSIFAATGALELKKHLPQRLKGKIYRNFPSKKLIVRLFIMFIFLQQITLGIFNTKAFSRKNR